jgi:hypothetical protein
MNRKVISLMAVMVLGWAGASGLTYAADLQPTPPPGASVPIDQTYPGGTKFTGGDKAPAFAPFDIDTSALPDARDLPRPPAFLKVTHQYTGIIKNKTRYDVSVPSANSGATIIIPAQGFIEYTIWNKHSDITAYYNGKPFYCLKVTAHPKNYDYMCKRYDFIAEIVKEEAIQKPKPSKMKKRLRKKTKVSEVEGLG